MGLGIGTRVAVVVAAAGLGEAQREGDLPDREDRGGIERSVVDLEAAETGIGQFAQEIDPRRGLAEMGEDR